MNSPPGYDRHLATGPPASLVARRADEPLVQRFIRPGETALGFDPSRRLKHGNSTDLKVEVNTGYRPTPEEAERKFRRLIAEIPEGEALNESL